MCVVGPAASGKSRLIRTLLGQERSGQGRSSLMGKAAVAGRDDFSRRATPQTLARKNAPGRKAQNTTDALLATALWDRRASALSELSGSQLAACELLPCLAGDEPVIVIDGQLDRLDPWTLELVREGLRRRLEEGAALIAATNRPDLAHDFDTLVVMVNNRIAFAGTVDELLRNAGESEIIVETTAQAGVRALVEPFEISVKSTPQGLLMHAREGQKIAAKLLMEGYGDVKSVVLTMPTIEQAIRRLVVRS